MVRTQPGRSLWSLKTRWVWCWAGSILVIVAATVLPLRTFAGYADWDKISWIPYRDPKISVEDVVENILLYVPLGFTFARWQRLFGWKLVLQTAWIAALLSAACETYQVFWELRYPSVTDVCDNSLGAILGAWLGSVPFRVAGFKN